MTISERIFGLLREQNKTQTALAAAIGIRIATVSAWKAQGTDPSANLLAGISAFLGVSIDFLCTGKEYAPAVSVQQGVFGDQNENNTVAINSNGAVSEIEGELLRICGKLDVRRKNTLLTRAYELESEVDGGNV